MPATRAILTHVRRMHRYIAPIGPCCLVGEVGGELRLRRVSDALGEAMIVQHPVDRQILNCDHIELIDDATAVLVGKIAPPPGDALMHASNDFAPLSTLRRPLLGFGQSALHLGERAFLGAQKAGVGDFLPGGEVAKVLRPTSMPIACPVGGSGVGSAHSHEKQTYRLPVLLREIVAVLGVPSSGRCSTTLTRPTLAMRTRLSSISNRHLGKGDAIITSRAPKARITGLLTCLAAAKEGVEGQIDADGDVLEHLRVYSTQRRPLGRERGQRCLLVIQAQ
jgi:hypothetical protein